MGYEWDKAKASENARKHGIRFADVIPVFEDAFAITLEDRRHAEDRWVTVGLDTLGRILVVAYTWRGANIRVISARKATARERHAYEAQE